jgi:hypothetical protein
MERILIRKGGWRIKFTCDYCGAEATDKESHYIRTNRHFCNADCYANYCRFDLPIEEHNRYGTGLPEDERQKRKAARSILNHAIRDGKVRRQPCEISGCVEWPEAHHDDYDKSLEVKWLCFVHHRQYHENPELLKVSP